MAAVTSLNFNVYEQYTSNTDATGTSSQSGALQAGVTVGTDDDSKYGSAIILDVRQAPASQKLAAGLKAVNTLTQVANYARTQAPKDAAAGRLAQAIESLRAINLVGGGIRAVQEVVRIAQEIAGAVRDLAAAEQAIAADGGASGGADGASAGAAAAAAVSAALSGSSGTATPSSESSASATADPTADPSGTAASTGIEAGYSGTAGAGVTGLIAGAADLGSGPGARQKAASDLAQAVVAQLQATGLPVDGSNLVGALQDLITNPVLGAQELQTSARQAGLTVTVATSLDVENTLTDPRDAASSGIAAGAAATAIDDPYDELVSDALAALGAVGKGLRRALPPLLNSPDKKIARDARRAQAQFAQAVADTLKSAADYYSAKSEVEAEGGSDGTPSPTTQAEIDAADAAVNGPSAGNDQGGTVDAAAGAGSDDTSLGSAAAVGDDGTPSISPGSVAGTSIGVHVSVSIEV